MPRKCSHKNRELPPIEQTLVARTEWSLTRCASSIGHESVSPIQECRRFVRGGEDLHDQPERGNKDGMRMGYFLVPSIRHARYSPVLFGNPIHATVKEPAMTLSRYQSVRPVPIFFIWSVLASFSISSAVGWNVSIFNILSESIDKFFIKIQIHFFCLS